MELKYTESEQVTNKAFGDDVAVMLLYGAISSGDYNGVHHIDFVHEMNYHISMGKHVVVKINSPGGNVYEGNSIQDAIEENGADTYIVGMAASMAGVISQSGKKRMASERAVFMAHPPQGGRKAEREIQVEYLTRALTGRSSMTNEEITELMTSKKEMYLNCDQMQEKGLIDEVITGGKPLNMELVNMSTNEIYAAYDSLLSNNKNHIKMENVINHFGLNAESTEEEVLNQIKDLEAKAAEELSNMVEENTTLKNKVEELENKINESNTERANELVNRAIKDGKLKEDAKESFVEFAVTNYDLAKSTLEGVSVSKVNNASVANAVSGQAKNVAPENKDYMYYMDNIDEMQDMLENDPEKWEAIENAYIEKKREELNK